MVVSAVALQQWFQPSRSLSLLNFFETISQLNKGSYIEIKVSFTQIKKMLRVKLICLIVSSPLCLGTTEGPSKSTIVLDTHVSGRDKCTQVYKKVDSQCDFETQPNVYFFVAQKLYVSNRRQTVNAAYKIFTHSVLLLYRSRRRKLLPWTIVPHCPVHTSCNVFCWVALCRRRTFTPGCGFFL